MRFINVNHSKQRHLLKIITAQETNKDLILMRKFSGPFSLTNDQLALSLDGLSLLSLYKIRLAVEYDL